MDNKFGDRYVWHRTSRKSCFFSGLLVLLILCSTASARDRGILSKQLKVKCSSLGPVMWATCLLNLTLKYIEYSLKQQVFWHRSGLVCFPSLGGSAWLDWKKYFQSLSLGDRQPHVVVLEEAWANTQVLMPERVSISSLSRVEPGGSLWQVTGIRHKFDGESSDPFFSQYEASLSWRAGMVFLHFWTSFRFAFALAFFQYPSAFILQVYLCQFGWHIVCKETDCDKATKIRVVSTRHI